MASTSIQPAAAATKTILTPVTTLKGHEGFIESMSYFPDGKRMVSGSVDNSVRRWDLQEGKEIEKVRDVCQWQLGAVAVSRDGQWVVTGGQNLKACEVETGIVKTFEGHSGVITSIDISADSTLLASASDDRTARIWSLDTGTLVAGPFECYEQVHSV